MNWKGERDYWLDHFGQYHPGNKRNSNVPPLTSNDYVGTPIPINASTPLAIGCLVWRWALTGEGYGILDGKGAHIIAFEQTRGRRVEPDMQVNHLCNRRFCVQPAHLYKGTKKQNDEDRRAAESGMGFYRTWEIMRDRFDKAMTDFYWEALTLKAVSPHWGDALECPHTAIPEMFLKKPQSGESKLCVNCDEGRSEWMGLRNGHRNSCDMLSPCRCEPCFCKLCLMGLLGPAQRAYEKAGNYVLDPYFTSLARQVENYELLSRDEARSVLIELKRWAKVEPPMN